MFSKIAITRKFPEKGLQQVYRDIAFTALFKFDQKITCALKCNFLWKQK